MKNKFLTLVTTVISLWLLVASCSKDSVNGSDNGFPNTQREFEFGSS